MAGKRLKLAVLTLLCLPASGWSQAPDTSAQAQQHYELGIALAQSARDDAGLRRGLEELLQARQLSPNWPDPCYSLALMFERLGDYNMASIEYGLYIALRPDAPDADEVRSAITRLEQLKLVRVNRSQMINMLSTMFDRKIWISSYSGNALDGPAPFARRGDKLAVIFPRTATGQKIDFDIDLPEAGVSEFQVKYTIRGFINMPPCPCDLEVVDKVRIVSPDRFEIEHTSHSNNAQMPHDGQSMHVFERVK